MKKLFALAIILIMTALTTVPYSAYAAETKESIRAMMGEPTQIKCDTKGKETWIYVIRPGEEDFPIYRLFAKYRSVKGFIFTFDKNGNLK